MFLMGDFKQSGSVEKGSEPWNFAQGYTNLKILKPLIEMDKLVKIAIYGCENIEDSMNLPEELKIRFRIESMNRLIDVLKEVIENSEFAMKQQGTSDNLEKLNQRVILVEKVIDGISKIETDSRNQTHKTRLNEDHFWLCLNELRAIKKEIPKPLNQNSLIFPTSDEIDLDKLKDQFIYGG